MPTPETTPSNGSNAHPEATPGENIREWFRDFIDLRYGSDRAGAVASIVNGKQMRGSNAWMLVCSILIASLGLNLNSGAVIIGAMLISPLMNPILGIGLGIGTNDWPMLWTALKNFGIAMLIALVTSVIYFVFTPIHTFTPEMQGRTEPTILDALVAVFGGLAGIISVTREDKTNAIPGVAIATALMPPLCVSGYGIALAITYPELGLTIFWRSFYLFFINSFFIAVTAYIIIRLLRFPYKKYINKAEARRGMVIVLGVSILMIIPSVYILQDVMTRLQEQEAARLFTEKYFPSSSSSYVLDRDEDKAPILIYPIKSRLMSADSIAYYSEILQKPPYALKRARIVTDTSLSASAMAGIQTKLSAMSTYTARLTNMEYRVQMLSQEMAAASSSTDIFQDTLAFAKTFKRLQLAFPEVESLALSYVQMSSDTSSYGLNIPLAIIALERSGKRPSPQKILEEKATFYAYLQTELNSDTLLVTIQEQ